MESGTAIQPTALHSHSSTVVDSSFGAGDTASQAPVSSLKSAELPDLSILTVSNDAALPVAVSCEEVAQRQQHQTVITPFGTPNGTPVVYTPVTMTPEISVGNISMETEKAHLRAQLRTYQEEVRALKQSIKTLEREKQDMLRQAETREHCRNDLMEKNQKLERENDDYLRNVVSANKKADFFEKNLREMRLKCQDYEEILRQHGLLPGLDGVAVTTETFNAETVYTKLRSERSRLESLIAAQNIKLDKLVQKGGRRPAVLDTKQFVPPGVMAATSQGARQKTRPSVLLEVAEAAWPALNDKQLEIDHTGTKPWCEAERQRTRWVQDDDRSLNATDREFKEMRLDKWIRSLPRPESTDGFGDDKDYVFVPDSSDLPTGHPNSGCQTFPRRRDQLGLISPSQNPLVEDVRGSMAPVHDQPALIYQKHGEVSNDLRRCPVCDMEFSDIIPTREYESHVADCCERASARDISSPPLNSPPASPWERTCPVCSGDFSSFAQKDFESHVESHFEGEDPVDGAAAQTPDVLDFRP